MNRSPHDARYSRLWKSLLVGRDDISWAGASAGDRGFCFGTEDGAVFWTNFDGVQYGKQLHNATLDNYDEAINGVAFNLGETAVTSRSGSAVWKNADSKSDKRKGGRVGVGSHGVVAAHNGAFFLPLNIGGLMSIHKDGPSHFSTFVSGSEAMDLNVYRIVSLATTFGRQVVGLAARHGGLAMGYYKPGDMLDLRTLELPGADFIDICPIDNPEYPSAAYALTRDNHILALDDVLNSAKPVPLRYGSMVGVAYRILSAGDFVFVLTSMALHVIHKLVDFSSGAFRVNRRTSNTSFPLDAIDMNLVGNRWLMVLMADRVLRLDLNELARDLASEFDVKDSDVTDVWANATIKERKLIHHRSDFALVK